MFLWFRTSVYDLLEYLVGDKEGNPVMPVSSVQLELVRENYLGKSSILYQLDATNQL